MSEKQMDVQDYPTIDSPATDPVEALVAAYYQYQGYLTSSAKWFWVRDPDKKQRGYQDIDVLAINDDEIIIVSVSGNLDDKVRFTRDGNFNQPLLDKQINYFDRVVLYLRAVPQYQWLLNNRQQKRFIAYMSGNSLANRIIMPDTGWDSHNIQLLHVGKIVTDLSEKIKEDEIKGFKTNNQIIKLLQIMTRLKTSD